MADTGAAILLWFYCGHGAVMTILTGVNLP